MNRVLSAMKGKELHEVIASGRKQLAVMGGGNAAAAVVTKVEAKVEKKVEVVEEEEEEDVDMGDLFGDF